MMLSEPIAVTLQVVDALEQVGANYVCQIAAKMGHAFAAKLVQGIGDDRLQLLRSG